MTTSPDVDLRHAPPLWAQEVRHTFRRLLAEGHPAPTAQAIGLVDRTFTERAYQDDVLIGPTHYIDVDGELGCGMVRGGPGAQSWAITLDRIRCGGCIDAVARLIFTGSIPAGPEALTEAGHRIGEQYLSELLGVPDWALPAGTEGTPLHAFSVHVRGMATRVVRMTLRLGVALETAQGQAERARAAIDNNGGLPSWSMLEPEPMLETAASAEGLRLLSSTLADSAAALVLTCTQVDRWLKAEAPGVTGDADAADRVVEQARDWRDLHRMKVATRTMRRAEIALAEAVDAHRRTLTPTVTMKAGEDRA